MPDLSTLSLFIVAAVILMITPGPAIFYIVARSIDQGRIAGLVSTLGINVGTLFHIGAAALGISALLVTSAMAFNVVKYLGAAYLIYLGVQKFLGSTEGGQTGLSEPQTLTRIFFQGMLVNLLNPKTALFFFAFLPQFVDVSRGPAGTQVLFLGMVYVALAIVNDGLYALLAGTLGKWLKGKAAFLRGQRYFSGTVFIGLGLATAFSGSSRSD